MSEEVELDVGAAKTLLEEAVAVLRNLKRLDRLTLPDPTLSEGPERGRAENRRRSRTASDTTRDLLHAAHLARRAASEIEAQYWRGRGYPDPLEVE